MPVRGLNFAEELPALRRWLEDVLLQEPPADEISGLYFGLFEPYDHMDNKPTCDMYVYGTPFFDPEDYDEEWAAGASTSSYSPSAARANSLVLHNLYRAFASHEELADEIGEEYLCLGYAGLSVITLYKTIPPSALVGGRTWRGVAVGWQSGDLHMLGIIERSGWRAWTPPAVG
jgi:hypothetical protein